MKKHPVLLVFLTLAVCAGLLALIMNADWYRRHYAFSGFEDQVTLFLMVDGERVPTSEYEATVGHSNLGEIELHRQKYCYSIAGDDHDCYVFDLTYRGKTAKVWLEHYNNWERTAIVVNVDRAGELTQTNLNYNSNPPWAEMQPLRWEE